MKSEDEEMRSTFSWHASYEAAMLELNPVELPAKVMRAVDELKQRSQELAFNRDANSANEWQALADALNNLSAIQKWELSPSLEERNESRQSVA